MNGKLTFQALNPKENVSAIMLPSGKELERKRLKQIKVEDEEEMVSMGEIVSIVVQKNMPLKQKDSDAFIIPCLVDNDNLKKGLI